MIKYISLLYLVATVSSTSHLRNHKAVEGNYDYAAADAAVDEAALIVLNSDEDYDEPRKHDSADFQFVHQPLVSKEDYDDLDEEITEEDFEKLDKEIAEEDEVNFLEEDGEEDENEEDYYPGTIDDYGYDDYWHGDAEDEEEDVGMIERMRGERNDHYPDATDAEYDEEDEEDVGMIERMRGERNDHYPDATDAEYDEEDEEDVGMIERMRGEQNDHYPDATDAEYDEEDEGEEIFFYDAEYDEEDEDAEYDEEDEENLGYWRSHDKIEFDKNGNQILNNNEDYEETDAENFQPTLNMPTEPKSFQSTLNIPKRVFKRIDQRMSWENHHGFIEDVPEISQTDIVKVTNWIKHEVAMVKNPFCWKQSYGRGVGVPLSTCPSNKDKIGALCYSKCPSKMSRFGFDCHSNCPSGSSGQGLFCRWNEYGRGTGYPWTFSDGFSDSGMYSRCERAHGGGKCEKWGAVVYPKCRSGYSPVGCCICRPKVPNCSSYSLNDGIDLSCAKKVIIGDPKPMNCKIWQDEDAGLCYEPCDSELYGAGPVCWQSCDNSMVDCGAGCAKSSGECALIVANQVLAPLILAANIASLGLATPATASTGAAVNTIKVGGKTVAGTSKLGKVFVKAVKTLQTAGSVQKIDGVENAVKGVKILQRFKNAKTGTTVKKTWTTIKISRNTYDISDDITDDATFSRDVYGALKEYKEGFANDFAGQTSSDINNELNRKFNPTTAQFLKETWAEYALNELAEAEAWQIASTTLGLVSIVDITGVTGVVEAYAKPVCNNVIQFPALPFTV